METYLPQTISWNLTRLCNLECAHCYLDAGARKGITREELDSEACLRIVEQVHQINPEALLILTGGEPLLRPDLEQIAAHATAMGLWVVVGTNGTMLSPERAVSLREAGVKGIGVSVDSMDPGKHDRFRGRPGAWQGAVDALAVAKEAGIDSVLQFTVNHWNREEIPEVVAFAKERGVHSVNFYFMVCTGRGQGASQLSRREAEEVYQWLYQLQQECAGTLLVIAKCAPQYQRYVHQQDPESPHLHTFKGGCPAATQYCRIDPLGDVTPCPYVPVAGGNLRQQTLAEIWNDSPVFGQLRRRENLGGKCGSCEYRSLCSGCRARALADNGYLMAEDPFCLHEPDGNKAATVLPAPGTVYFEEENAGNPAVEWQPEAMEILQRIPPFVRGMVRQRLEKYAQKEGLEAITGELMTELREKRLPFLKRPPGV